MHRNLSFWYKVVYSPGADIRDVRKIGAFTPTVADKKTNAFKSTTPEPKSSTPEALIKINPNIPYTHKKYQDVRGFGTIIGKVTDQITECAEILKNFEAYEKIVARMPPGLLIPPQALGKQAFVGAVAEEANIWWLSSATQFNNPYFGNSPKRMYVMHLRECEKERKENHD